MNFMIINKGFHKIQMKSAVWNIILFNNHKYPAGTEWTFQPSLQKEVRVYTIKIWKHKDEVAYTGQKVMPPVN